MRNFAEKIYSLSIYVTILMLLTACGPKVTEEIQEQVVRPVKLLVIQETNDHDLRRYPAIIEAATSRDLSFQVGGLLQELPISEAQEIQEGDLIAKLDQRDFKNNLDSAKAQFEIAEEEYQRAVRLAKEDAIARSALEQRKSQRDVAKAQLDSAEKALSDSVLRAPFTGVVAKVPAQKLQAVQPGSPIATIIEKDGLQAIVNAPASLVAQANNRTDKKGFVLLDAAPAERIPAEFKEITLEADPTSQTFAITFSFQPPENLIILPGMNATMELSSFMNEAEGNNKKVEVPLGAVLSDGEKQYVWVVDTDMMTVSRREIVVDDSIGETILIKEGLKPGETIAGAGASYLAEGMQVRPWIKQ